MIWVQGRIVPDDSLTIGVRDRTFEHGLGLFETLRTWNGRAPLLARHLARLRRSADALGLPLDPADLPAAAAVAALRGADGIDGDALLRITLTGGDVDSGGSTLWMCSAPLPPPAREGGAVVALGLWEVAFGDPLARHKSLNYWARRLAFEKARDLGADEALGATADLRYWEGSRTNLFLVKDQVLTTPSLEGPIVPGVMRGLVLDMARALGLECRESAHVSRALIRYADEVFLTNSVRGVVPVSRVDGYSYQARGRWTLKLREAAAGEFTKRDVPP